MNAGLWETLLSKAGTIFGGISDNMRATGQSVSYIVEAGGRAKQDAELGKKGTYNKTLENQTKYRSYAIAGCVGAVCLAVMVIFIVRS